MASKMYCCMLECSPTKGNNKLRPASVAVPNASSASPKTLPPGIASFFRLKQPIKGSVVGRFDDFGQMRWMRPFASIRGGLLTGCLGRWWFGVILIRRSVFGEQWGNQKKKGTTIFKSNHCFSHNQQLWNGSSVCVRVSCFKNHCCQMFWWSVLPIKKGSE